MWTREIQTMVQPLVADLDTNPKALAYMIASTAKKRAGRDPEMFGDLVQEGLLGIEKARKTFDPTHGALFHTYAYYWIRVAMRDYHRANLRTVEVFRGRKGRAAYDDPRQVDVSMHREVQLDDQDSEEETPFVLRSDPDNDPESLCIAKQQIEAVRALTKQARNARESAIWDAISGDHGDIAETARALGCSRQNVQQTKDRMLRKARRTLRGCI
jgi:RNA polymerase sigma factor (sigma-70 family)